MEFKTLKDIEHTEIMACINEAFSDYAIPIHLTENTLKKFFESSDISTTLSYCALVQNKVIGFILNSANYYRGEKVVFDAGTGIIPEFRGKGVFTALYAHTENELKKNNIKKYYLEVLQQNEQAISLYKKTGFSIVRPLSVFEISKIENKNPENNIQILPLQKFNFEQTKTCTLVTPSFENSSDIIYKADTFFNVAFIECKKEVLAFCIYNKVNGNIMQLGYKNVSALEKIITYIASHYQTIIAKNIDTTFHEIVDLLLSIGFKEIAKQYEMVKKL